MAVTKAKKDQVLAELIEAFKDAKAVAVARTSGLSVNESQDFRGQLREQGVSFKIAKKTLICLAAKEAGYEIDKSQLDGSVGLAFSPDEVTGPKAVDKFDVKNDAKERKVNLVAVFMDGKVMSEAQAKELASIPGKEELLAKFVGMLQSPLNSFAGMLNSPLSSFARAVQAYADQQPADGSTEQSEAPTETAEAPAEDAAPAAEEAEAPAEEKAEDAPAEEEAKTDEETPEESQEENADA